ncbi:hypothetical protein HMPREF9422_1355 [Streptococcus cristatus ATCC 51100]|uniref:Uncharacterized protein n=1 Tax=Streptococcus cristatus ATCC 51100 TaxID=889201 RepID=A0AAV3EHD3_STRCR|nr:hypothetical protein HMPREF9422_1355 [Streptococcus cristatus ATCC 51100]EGU68990.1 hypothetical protein HMPREF9960_0192 [Streptococcus cristatus ATCC 51100]
MVRVTFQGTHHADNIKTRNRIIAVPFSLLYRKKFVHRAVLDYFFVKCLFLLKKLVQ